MNFQCSIIRNQEVTMHGNYHIVALYTISLLRLIFYNLFFKFMISNFSFALLHGQGLT